MAAFSLLFYRGLFISMFDFISAGFQYYLGIDCSVKPEWSKPWLPVPLSMYFPASLRGYYYATLLLTLSFDYWPKHWTRVMIDSRGSVGSSLSFKSKLCDASIDRNRSKFSVVLDFGRNHVMQRQKLRYMTWNFAYTRRIHLEINWLYVVLSWHFLCQILVFMNVPYCTHT